MNDNELNTYECQQTILVWTTRNDIFGKGVGIDHWQAFDSLEDARSEYNKIINRDDVFSASICGVIESTDYEPTMKAQSFMTEPKEDYPITVTVRVGGSEADVHCMASDKLLARLKDPKEFADFTLNAVCRNNTRHLGEMRLEAQS